MIFLIQCSGPSCQRGINICCARACARWDTHGCTIIHYSHLANEEVRHSSGLIDHVLYLNGTPDVEHLDAVAQGQDVKALFQTDLKFEREDVEWLRKAIAHCTEVGDFTTRHRLSI